MQDYKEIMKAKLLEFYEPSSLMENILPSYQTTTSELLKWFQGVIPKKPIDEHDVFEILQECGFKQVQKIETEKICIVQENKKKGIKAEYDEQEVGRILVWNLHEIL